MKKILVLTLLLFISVSQAQSKLYSEKEVEVNPGFPGGWNYWIEFVQKNFKWKPEQNGKNIVVEFTVQPNGSVTDVKILNPNGSPNEKEALRVMTLSPKWTPASIKGKVVPCRLSRGMFNPYLDDSESGNSGLTIEGPKGDPSPAMDEHQDDNSIYNTAGIEVRPDFPGGLQKFYDFFNANYKLPETEDVIKGKIFVTFVVEKDGTITDVKIIRDIGYGTGNEAIRVLKAAPKWNPGKHNGKLVRVLYSLPIAIDNTTKTLLEKK